MLVSTRVSAWDGVGEFFSVGFIIREREHHLAEFFEWSIGV